MGGSFNIAPDGISRPRPGLHRTTRGVVLAVKNAGRGRRGGCVVYDLRGYDVLGQEKRELRGLNHARALQDWNNQALHERAEFTL
jgi:hypothetical protein